MTGRNDLMIPVTQLCRTDPTAGKPKSNIYSESENMRRRANPIKFIAALYGVFYIGSLTPPETLKVRLYLYNNSSQASGKLRYEVSL